MRIKREGLVGTLCVIFAVGCAGAGDGDGAASTSEALTDPRSYGVDYDVYLYPSNPPQVCNRWGSRHLCRTLVEANAFVGGCIGAATSRVPTSGWGGMATACGSTYEGCTRTSAGILCKYRQAGLFYTRPATLGFYANAAWRTLESAYAAASCLDAFMSQDPQAGSSCITPP
jgi:hypothetical protein